MAKQIIDVKIIFSAVGDLALEKARATMVSLGNGAKLASASMTALGPAVMAAGAALGAAAMAGQQLYQMLKDAAPLVTTKERFDKLSASIGTTADVLLGRLREATQGIMTDMQLMSSATQLMSLGLVKNEEQVVRLATVAGRLNWNMDQLVLTFANMSKLRLDALGLSVEEVVAKSNELKAAGMSAQDAWKEAVIQAGEARLEVAGLSELELSIRQLETAAQNAEDQFKLTFGSNLAQQVSEAAGGAEELAASMIAAARGAGELTANIAGPIFDVLIAEGQSARIRDLREELVALGMTEEEIRAQVAANITPANNLPWSPEHLQAQREQIEFLQKEIEDLKRNYSMSGSFLPGTDNVSTGAAQLQKLREQATATAKSADELRQQFGKWERQSNVNSSATLKLADGTKYTKYQLSQLGDQVGKTWYQMKAMLSSGTAWVVDGKVITDEIAQANEDAARESARRVREQHREAAMAMAEEYKAAARAASEAFMAALQPGGQVNFGDTRGMKQAALDMAGSFGLTVPILADIGTQLGVIDQKTAESAIKAALYKDAMGTLFGMLQNGTIDTSGFVEAFDNLIADLNNKSLVDIQVGLKVKQGESIQLKDILPEGVRMPDGDMGFTMPVQLSPEEEALNQALDNLDGVQGDASLDVTFKPLTSAVDEAIQNYRNASVNVRVNFTAPGIGPDRDGDGVPDDADNYPNDPTRRQLGGPVRRGKPYLVGEAGPELFVPGMSGFVVSNNNMQARSGNMNVTINVSGSAAQPERVGAAVKDAMTQFWSDLRFEGVSW